MRKRINRKTDIADRKSHRLVFDTVSCVTTAGKIAICSIRLGDIAALPVIIQMYKCISLQFSDHIEIFLISDWIILF